MIPNVPTSSRLLSLTALLLALQATHCIGRSDIALGSDALNSAAGPNGTGGSGGVDSGAGGVTGTGGVAATPSGGSGGNGNPFPNLGESGGSASGGSGSPSGIRGGAPEGGFGGCSGTAECNPALTGVLPGQNGAIRREYWLGLVDLGDYSTKILRETIVRTPPSGSDRLFQLQADGFGDANTNTINYGNDFGERMFGFIRAPETGTYQFFVSGDNQVVFFLSADDKYDSIAQKLDYCRNSGVLLPCASSSEGGPAIGAESRDYTPREGFTEPSQTSVPVTLEAGKYYFFDWYHKETQGDTHAQVKWATPGRTVASLEIVPGSVLYYPVFPRSAGGASNAGGG